MLRQKIVSCMTVNTFVNVDLILWSQMKNTWFSRALRWAAFGSLGLVFNARLTPIVVREGVCQIHCDFGVPLLSE